MSKINKIKLSGTTYDIQDLSATSVVNVTQAEYDALVTGGTVDPTTLYNITDAQAGDLSQYWTSAQTNSAITQAVSGKQDTLISGTNIKTINNESILGSGNIDIQGGGSSYTAGRGIDITNDTISFNLPISAGTGANSLIIGESTNISNSTRAIATGYKTKAQQSNAFAQGYKTVAGQEQSHAEGYETRASGINSHSEGKGTSAMTVGSHAEGLNTITSNSYEHTQGQYNVSNSASTAWGDSGNTLFSVGNGTAENARHNAFEIRQNGDIYITSGGTDIKLQDNLGGGGGGSITIDPSLDTSSTNPVANSAITRNLTDGGGEIINSGGRYQWGFYSVGGYSTNKGFYLDIINGEPVVRKYSNTRSLQLVETSAITTSISSSSTDAQVPSAKAVNDKLGGLSIVKLTQSEYDALATKDSNTLYVIVN